MWALCEYGKLKMTDITALSVGLQSIKTAIDITKELRNIDASLKDAEVKLKIIELVEALSEVKLQLSEVRDENLDLKEKIKKLEGKLNQQEEVEFRDNHYFLKNPKQGQAPGPFCSNCYSDGKKLISVSALTGHFQTFGKYRCPKCRATSN